MSEANQTPPSKFSLDTILATTQTHRTYWLAGGGVVAAAAVAAIVVFGGFLGPSGKDICMASLTQAKDFGVISPDAKLASSSAKSTDVKNRRQCSVTVGEDSFTLLADLKAEDATHKKCKDFKKQAGCIALYSVARSDGMTTYQVREIPPGETDEALAAENPQPAPSAAPGAAPASEPGGIDNDTAVDNSGGMQSAPAQQTPPPQQ